jgi:hypothetical protein
MEFESLRGRSANQIEHHRAKTFEEEYQALLRLTGLNFVL